jgi:sugar phosphate isomerase/epimerase
MSDSFNRRDFLKTAALFPLCAAGGLSLASVPAVAQQQIKRPGKSRLKIGLNAYSFARLLNDQLKGRGTGISLFDLIDFCAQQDFDAVDATGYFFPGYPALPADDYVNRLKRHAFECGIDISGTGVRNNFTVSDKAKRAADVQHIKEWVEVAARLGAPVLRVFSDTQMRNQSWETVAKGYTRDQVEEWIADDLRACADHGKKFGVIIGVQNHGDFLRTSENHLSLMKRVGSEWCGPIIDTGYYKSEDPYRDIERVAPYAVNWQIKESPVGAGSEVKTDLKRVIGIARSVGYRGYLPIETLSAPGTDYDPYKVVPPFLAKLRQAIEETA